MVATSSSSGSVEWEGPLECFGTIDFVAAAAPAATGVSLYPESCCSDDASSLCSSMASTSGPKDRVLAMKNFNAKLEEEEFEIRSRKAKFALRCVEEGEGEEEVEEEVESMKSTKRIKLAFVASESDGKRVCSFSSNFVNYSVITLFAYCHGHFCLLFVRQRIDRLSVVETMRKTISQVIGGSI